MPTKRKHGTEAGGGNEDDVTTSNWSKLNVTQLKTELEGRGLGRSGLKADLVARLEAADSEAPSTAFSPAATTKIAGETPVAWSKMNVAELKAELESRNLSKSGTKPELVGRLEAAENGNLTEAGAAPRRKRPREEANSEEEVLGPLANEVVQYQDRSASGEKRIRPFVAAPDVKYKDKLKRIKKERMFMLSRMKIVDRDGYDCEIFDIAGSTGNVYQTTIGRSPSCVCMDARIRGQKCKHINYALIIILKAPAHLCYQLAFLSDELALIFANAPVTQAPEPEQAHDDSTEIYNGTRKPIDSECPICVFDMEPDEQIVWCKASCGQNFHKECFDQWKRSKMGGRVTCVYCRAEWQEDSVSKPPPGSMAALLEEAPKVGSYRNVGHHAMYQQEKE